MHVQGDDGFGGFCKRHGWLGLKIHVNGERWNPVTMTPFEADVKGAPLQESVLVHYPYLQPSADVRNFTMHYTATVKKVIGDDATTVQLTDGASSASGISTKSDPTGNLIIDASAAFLAWRNSNPSPAPLHANFLAPGTAANIGGFLMVSPGSTAVDAKAVETCRTKGPDEKVYDIIADPTSKEFTVICGVDPETVAKGTPAGPIKTATVPFK